MGFRTIRLRDALIFLLSLILAAGVAVLLKFFMFVDMNKTAIKPLQTVAPVIQTVKVLVAGDDIEVGTLLEPTLIRWKIWPADDLPADYITEAKNPDLKTFQKEMIVTGLKKGDPIRKTYLASSDGNATLPALITPGMRAFTLSLERRNSLAINLLSPGDRIDVFMTTQINGTDGRQTTQNVIENVKVLAVEHFIDRVDSKKLDDYVKAVTLEVSPNEAEKLALDLNNNGVPFLALKDLKSYRYGKNVKEISPYIHNDALNAADEIPVKKQPDTPDVAKPTQPGIMILRQDKRQEIGRPITDDDQKDMTP